MARISVLITSSPENVNLCINALAFCEQTYTKGDTIDQIFFYQSGVYHASHFVVDSADNIHWAREWQRIAEKHTIPLHVCVGAAAQRGIIDQTLAGEHGIAHFNLQRPFQQVGLGEFFTLLHQSNKLVQF